MTGSSDYNDSCYEAWQRGIRANCEKHGLIYPSDDAPDDDELPFNDGFWYEYTKVTDNDDSFIGNYEDRYGTFNPSTFLADPALVAPLTFKQVLQRKSPLTDIFTSQSNALCDIIAQNYHNICIIDVHRQLKIAVRKRLQRMHQITTVRDIFQGFAEQGRIYVTRTIRPDSITHQLTLVLPDYDDPANQELDYDHELLPFTLEQDQNFMNWQSKNPATRNRSLAELQTYYIKNRDTVNPRVVTVSLMVTKDIIFNIPPVHLPISLHLDDFIFSIDGPAFMELTVDMDYRQITDIFLDE